MAGPARGALNGLNRSHQRAYAALKAPAQRPVLSLLLCRQVYEVGSAGLLVDQDELDGGGLLECVRWATWARH